MEEIQHANTKQRKIANKQTTKLMLLYYVQTTEISKKRILAGMKRVVF